MCGVWRGVIEKQWRGVSTWRGVAKRKNIVPNIDGGRRKRRHGNLINNNDGVVAKHQ